MNNNDDSDNQDSRDVPIPTLLDEVKRHVQELEQRNPSAIRGCVVLLEYSKDYEEEYVERQEGDTRDGPDQHWCSGLSLNEVLTALDTARVSYLMTMMEQMIDERLRGDRGF